MPISCHFRDCKALLVTSLTHVSGAIANVQTLTALHGNPLQYTIQEYLHCDKKLARNFVFPRRGRRRVQIAFRSTGRMLKQQAQAHDAPAPPLAAAVRVIEHGCSNILPAVSANNQLR